MGKTIANRVCDYYFDDAACGLTLDPTESATPKIIATKMQQMVQDFEEMLHQSGGGISLIKSFWYPIIWKWENATPQMEDNLSEANVRIINRETNSYTNLKQRAPSESHATLGAFIAPSENWDSEFKNGKNKRTAGLTTSAGRK